MLAQLLVDFFLSFVRLLPIGREGQEGDQRGKKGRGGEIANHPRENLKKAAIRGSKNASQIKKGAFDDDAVTLWVLF